MPPTSYLLEITLVAIALALATGAFGAWCASRYGKTEKRYLIQYAPFLPCFALLMYFDMSHHVYWGVGIFSCAYYLALRIFSSMRKRKEENQITK